MSEIVYQSGVKYCMRYLPAPMPGSYDNCQICGYQIVGYFLSFNFDGYQICLECIKNANTFFEDKNILEQLKEGKDLIA